MSLFHELLTDPDESYLIGDCLTDLDDMRVRFYLSPREQQEPRPLHKQHLTNQRKGRKVTT